MSGRSLGRYRLTTSAEAAAGTVLPAEDTLFDRQVGLLLVPEAVVADPARLARIRQEVERATALVHPNVATVYGLEEGGGRLFVTMQKEEGTSLASLLAAGGLPLESALETALALADVLAAAKEAGVVHGALRPADVRLSADGSITVGGFGLHELRLAVAEESAQTAATAAYRPPEAAPGVLPDHRADLFVLGRLVQEMLAAGGAPSAAEQRLPAAAKSDLLAVAGSFAGDDPAQRPHSADELRPPIERLQRELLREPEPEPDEAAPQRRLPAAARWGLVAAAVVLVGIAAWALLGGGGESQQATDPVESLDSPVVEIVDLAVMPFTTPEERDGTNLAVGFGRELTRLLERDRSVSVIAASSAARAAASGAGRERIGDLLGAAHLLEGSFFWQRDDDISRAEVTVRLSRTSDGEVLWSETLEGFFGEVAGLQDRVVFGVARRLGTGSRRGARQLTDSPAAYEAYLEGVGGAATAAEPKALAAALESFESAAILDSGLLPAHTAQVALRIGLAAREPAADALSAAGRALEQAKGIDPGDPAVRRAMAELEVARGGAPAVAFKELEAALDRLPGDPGLLRMMASIDRRQGRWGEAVDRLSAARRRDPLDTALVAELVRSLIWTRRFDEARERIDGLAALLPESLEPLLLRSDLLLRERGDTGGARAALEAAAEPARADRRWRQSALELDLYEGDYQAALARLPGLEFERAEELIEQAWIQRHMGNSRRAAAAFEKARDLLDDRLEADALNPWLSSLLAQAYAGTGGMHLADRMGRRAVTQLPVTRDAVAGVGLVERLARTYVLAGDSEHALDELAFLLEIPSPLTVAVLRLDPAWEPLRAEPRFQELLDRFGP